MHITELMEPEAVKVGSAASLVDIATLSCAISLKKIADTITNKEDLKELVHTLGLVPMNSYGEGLVEGIQNAIARGRNGMTTYDR